MGPFLAGALGPTKLSHVRLAEVFVARLQRLLLDLQVDLLDLANEDVLLQTYGHLCRVGFRNRFSKSAPLVAGFLEHGHELVLLVSSKIIDDLLRDLEITIGLGGEDPS